MFDEKTQQSIKSYVYMLTDPSDNRPFYVGKGTGNRIFDHLRCALTRAAEVNAKYEIIRQIQARGDAVKHIIVQHGLSEDHALQVEASVIDVLRYCNIGLSNLVSGHNADELGLMTTDEISRRYNSEPLNYFPDNFIMININKKYKRGNGKTEIFEATKGIWAIDMKKLQALDDTVIREYVLSEYKGLIVEVFKVKHWYEQSRSYNKTAKKSGQTRVGVAFDGEVAAPEIRDRYINKSIAHLKKKGVAGVHRFKL